MDLKGVGVKVASCIALFGYHRLEIPPVDVWIRRVTDQIYGGAPWRATAPVRECSSSICSTMQD